MRLVDASIRYPVSVVVVILLGVVFGTLSLFRIPIQMIPTLDKPEISVKIRSPGSKGDPAAGMCREGST